MSSCSVFNKYSPDSNFGGRKVLNAGCGFSRFLKPNVVNLDAFSNCSPDVVWDLNKTPYPFEDNTFDLVIANHIVEHLDNWWGAFNEFARILKPGGICEIWVPGSGSDSELGFRDHVRIINHCSFYGIVGTSRGAGNAWAKEQDAKKEPAAYMKLIGAEQRMEKKLWNRFLPQSLKQWCAYHLRNVLYEESYVFKKLTGEELNAAHSR